MLSFIIFNNIKFKSETERDLGVIFSTNLKWKDQVFLKANQMLGQT